MLFLQITMQSLLFGIGQAENHVVPGTLKAIICTADKEFCCYKRGVS